ncbi:protein Flattop [Hoplias malabaricus]|uniref:protein Flattop n=1 Tax=Hoplias malabaricus TaxID=27720 RepID=UPI0034631099
MSSSFTANQYENAFKSHTLQNWTLPKHFKEKPSVAEGHTKFIANDQGHLLPGVKRGSSWTSFHGTWDLPNRIPPIHVNPTARSLEGQERLRIWGQTQVTDKLTEGYVSRSTSKTPHTEKTDMDQQHEEPQIIVSTPAPDGPEKLSIQAPSRDATPQSQPQSRPATQQSWADPQLASRQNKSESRPTSQQNQESRVLTQAMKAQSRPVSQASRKSQ